MKKQDKKIVDLVLRKLKPHPRNAELYTRRSRKQIEELAEDMQKHGQIEDVEVTSDGMIISGHGRWEAAKLLRWKTIRCWVRDDLEKIGPEAIEARLVEANLCRRQMSRMEMVRSYRRLKQMERDHRGRRLSDDRVKGDLRDIIAKRYGMSGRNLDRWLRVLQLPMALQEAVDQGVLKLTEAVKVAAESKNVQQAIAVRVEEVMADEAADIKQRTKTIKAILADHFEKEANGRQGVAAMLDRLVNALKKGRAELGHRIHEVKGGFLGTTLEDLRKSKNLIETLITRMERNSRQTANKLKQKTKAHAADEEE